MHTVLNDLVRYCFLKLLCIDALDSVEDCDVLLFFKLHIFILKLIFVQKIVSISECFLEKLLC